MADKELVGVDLSSESDLDLVIVDGEDGKKLRFTVGYAGKGASAGAFIDVTPEYFAEKLKNAIPGEIDDLVIDTLVAGLLK